MQKGSLNSIDISSSLLTEEFASNMISNTSDWNEPEKSEVDIDKLIMENTGPGTGFNFFFLFVFSRQQNLTPLNFLRKFFKVEIGVCCMSVVGSIIATLYGMTYFTIDPDFDRDNQLIGLTCGCSGLVFSMFKFYFTLISLKNIKKEVFVAEIACAAGLSILTQAVLIIVCVVFLILAILVGL